MLSIFSRAYWPFVCLLWRRISSNPWLVLKKHLEDLLKEQFLILRQIEQKVPRVPMRPPARSPPRPAASPSINSSRSCGTLLQLGSSTGALLTEAYGYAKAHPAFAVLWFWARVSQHDSTVAASPRTIPCALPILLPALGRCTRQPLIFLLSP